MHPAAKYMPRNTRCPHTRIFISATRQSRGDPAADRGAEGRMNNPDANSRWDQHTVRHVEIAKAGTTAVTLLNSGSWIALLSQAGKLGSAPSPEHVATALLAWGLGALLATSVWLFIHLNSVFVQAHDFDRDNRWFEFGLDATMWLGRLFAISALVSFGWGVLALSTAFQPAQ